MQKEFKESFNFYLTKKQKESVDNFLIELANGNYNSRRYKYYYILHLINTNSVFGKCDETFISSRSLEKHFHDNSVTAEIKENLQAWGIIKMTKNYSFNPKTGKKQAPAFIVLPDYQGKLDEVITIKFGDKKVPKFIFKLIQERNQKIKEYNGLLSEIYDNLQLLSVDAPEAVVKESCMLQHIFNQDFNVSESQYGRITTTLCSVERVNKKFVKFNGNHLYEVDITNSQPLLSLILFRRYFEALNQSLPNDLIDMYDRCQDGTFYNHLMDELQIPQQERSQFKKNFFELFYASNKGKDSKLYPVFNKYYPNVANALYEIKKGNYKLFARELQKIESTLIFGVLKKLYAEGIHALTIHDSIVLSNQADAKYTADLLLNEFSTHHQLKPKLTISYYGENNSSDQKTKDFKYNNSVISLTNYQPFLEVVMDLSMQTSIPY